MIYRSTRWTPIIRFRGLPSVSADHRETRHLHLVTLPRPRLMKQSRIIDDALSRPSLRTIATCDTRGLVATIAVLGPCHPRVLRGFFKFPLLDIIRIRYRDMEASSINLPGRRRVQEDRWPHGLRKVQFWCCGADCGTPPGNTFNSGSTFVPEEVKHMEKQSYCNV